MLRQAAEEHDTVWVVLNTDRWLVRKKGYLAVPLEDRMDTLLNMTGVSRVIEAEEDVAGTVSASLLRVCTEHPDISFTFCNGGDRPQGRVPEEEFCGHLRNLSFQFGVGGDTKLSSSSSIWGGGPSTERLWGHYVDHLRTDRCVFKTLHVRPGEGTSLQVHIDRDEVWHVHSGTGIFTVGEARWEVTPGSSAHVPAGIWHQIEADGNESLVVREMQYGHCREEDIERRES